MRRQACGRIERLGDLQELPGSSRPPRAARSTAGPMSWAPPMPMPERSVSSSRVWSVSSRRGDDDRVRRGLDRLRRALRGRERGGRGQPLADERELQQGLGPGIHRSSAQRRGAGGRTGHALARPETATSPAATAATAGRPPLPRRSRCPPGGLANGVGSTRSPASRRRTPVGAHRSAPVHEVSMPKAAATRPGPLARRWSGVRARAAAVRPAPRPSGPIGGARRRQPRARMASMPSMGATARMSTAPAVPGPRSPRSDSHASRRQGTRRRGRPGRTSPRPAASGRIGRGRQIVRSAVGLHLDDPADRRPVPSSRTRPPRAGLGQRPGGRPRGPRAGRFATGSGRRTSADQLPDRG